MIFPFRSFIILKLFRSISVFSWFFLQYITLLPLKKKKTFNYGLGVFFYISFFFVMVLWLYYLLNQILKSLPLWIILLWFFHNNFLILDPKGNVIFLKIKKSKNLLTRALQASSTSPSLKNACSWLQWWKPFFYHVIQFILASSSSSHDVYGQRTSDEAPATFFYLFIFSFLLAIQAWPFKFEDQPFKLFFFWFYLFIYFFCFILINFLNLIFNFILF